MFDTAYALGTGGVGGEGAGGFAGFIPLILMFVIFYFLLIRPQQKNNSYPTITHLLPNCDPTTRNGYPTYQTVIYCKSC